MEVNACGSRYLAEVCHKIGAKLLLISSDYVFPGTGDDFYEVDSPTRPVNVYGSSKAEAEQAVRKILPKHFIVRISWVFGKNGGNFIKTMLRLGRSQNEVRVVEDQIGSPTYTVDDCDRKLWHLSRYQRGGVLLGRAGRSGVPAV